MTRTPADFGMVTPAGTELMAEGDNAITINAQKVAEWLGKILEGVIEPIAILDAEDLNAGKFRIPGWYYCRLTATAATIQNRPPGIGDGPFMVHVAVTPFNYVTQTYYGYSGAAAGMFERNTANAAGTSFIPWGRLNNLPDMDYRSGIAHAMREQAFQDRVGPVRTDGKGAVALRFDHGLANFDTKIRPLLEARNLPYALAINSRSWSLPENGSVTPGHVNGWVTGGLCEILNHGAHHGDAVDPAAQEDTILGGLNELRGQLPAAIIEGFAVPGVGGTSYNGFDSTKATAFGDTTAGRIIMRHHAFSTGYVTGTSFRPLDGRLRQGQGHHTFDSATLAGAQANINSAATNRTGLQIMLHPSLIDTAGYMTTATLTAVLDHIVAKRNAGELVVLSPSRLLLADNGIASARVTVDNTVGRRAFAWDAANNRPQMIYADSGWRDISASVPAGITVSQLRIRRVGGVVFVTCQLVSTATAGNVSIVTLPMGFQADPIALRVGVASDRSGTSVRQVSPYAGALRILEMQTGKAYELGISFTTNDLWPAALPGDAVGPVPIS